MNTETLDFLGFQGQRLFAMLWLPDGEVRGVLQIVHGMTEHIERYTALAQALTLHGFAVAGFDLRGHGRNPGNPEIASFGEDGWEGSLQDTATTPGGSSAGVIRQETGGWIFWQRKPGG